METFWLLILLGVFASLVMYQAFQAAKDEQAPQTIDSTPKDEKRRVAVECFPEAKVWRVIDGDTVIVGMQRRQRITIRLAAIDAPEDGQPGGEAATVALIRMIGGKVVRVETHEEDCYGRTVATLYVRFGSRWVNVNERMVTLGHAWVLRRYYAYLPHHRRVKLNALERWARRKSLGLWQDKEPIAPWIWRRREDYIAA